MTLSTLEIWGILSMVFALGGLAPYFYALFKGQTKPHAFSWIIWSFVMIIVCAAQFTAGAGPGAWLNGFASTLCLAIGLISLKKGEKNITKSDWVAFIFALLAIPLWVFTKEPLWSVILLTLIDLSAYYPTIRKSWPKPHEETAVTYGVSCFVLTFSILATDVVNLTTILYPAVFIVVNAFVCTMLLTRRRILARV